MVSTKIFFVAGLVGSAVAGNLFERATSECVASTVTVTAYPASCSATGVVIIPTGPVGTPSIATPVVPGTGSPPVPSSQATSVPVAPSETSPVVPSVGTSSITSQSTITRTATSTGTIGTTATATTGTESVVVPTAGAAKHTGAAAMGMAAGLVMAHFIVA